MCNGGLFQAQTTVYTKFQFFYYHYLKFEKPNIILIYNELQCNYAFLNLLSDFLVDSGYDELKILKIEMENSDEASCYSIMSQIRYLCTDRNYLFII